MNIFKKYISANYKWLIFVLIAISWIVYGILIFVIVDDSNTRGQIGDMFGAINALFTGLALAGVIVSNIIQNETLKLQSKDLELYYKELKDNTLQLESQNKIFQAQLFETTLFNLINAHRKRVENIRSNSVTDKEVGEELIVKYAMDIYDAMKTEEKNGQYVMFTLHAGELLQYIPFNQVYINVIFILKLINDVEDQEKKELYGKIFTIQMSSAEKFLYNLIMNYKLEVGMLGAQDEATLFDLYRLNQTVL